jgi:hypothetical protein
MAFPFPFSIIVAICTLGLLIARKFKNQTQVTTTLLTITDVTLKLNWIFLLSYLFAGSYYVSAIIFSYCLLANLLVNFLLFRIPFSNHNLLFDPQFSPYRLRYPRFLSTLLYLSSILSFHLFRLTHSKLLGIKSLSASFQQNHLLQRLLNQTTYASLILVTLPGAAGCIYNLCFAAYLSQVWYFDIDGLILVGIEIVLIAIDFKRVSVTAMVEDFRDTVGVEEENKESFSYQQGGGRVTNETHQRVLI